MKFYYWIALVILIFILILAVVIFIRVRKSSSRKNNILKVFQIACKRKGIEHYQLTAVKKETHDFYFESEKHIYYVKVIYNPANHEICINNAIKWQIRKLGDMSENLVFASGIEPLMRLDLKNKEKKEHKLFIVYPNTRALLKVINECEMVFVYPDTDVYGAQVVTYKELNSNPDLLEI